MSNDHPLKNNKTTTAKLLCSTKLKSHKLDIKGHESTVIKWEFFFLMGGC